MDTQLTDMKSAAAFKIMIGLDMPHTGSCLVTCLAADVNRQVITPGNDTGAMDMVVVFVGDKNRGK